MKKRRSRFGVDVKRAQEILKSPETIQVLHNGSPVWIENIKDNNTADVTYFEGNRRETVPVYKLVENSPVK